MIFYFPPQVSPQERERFRKDVEARARQIEEEKEGKQPENAPSDEEIVELIREITHTVALPAEEELREMLHTIQVKAYKKQPEKSEDLYPLWLVHLPYLNYFVPGFYISLIDSVTNTSHAGIVYPVFALDEEKCEPDHLLNLNGKEFAPLKWVCRKYGVETKEGLLMFNMALCKPEGDFGLKNLGTLMTDQPPEAESILKIVGLEQYTDFVNLWKFQSPDEFINICIGVPEAKANLPPCRLAPNFCPDCHVGMAFNEMNELAGIVVDGNLIFPAWGVVDCLFTKAFIELKIDGELE